jgi:tRNA(adenine34) deaminase
MIQPRLNCSTIVAMTDFRREVHDRDAGWMRMALAEAAAADAAGEVPIGAVVVVSDSLIARAYNRPIGAIDPTAHAEILALRAAAHAVGNYRLVDAEVFVTVEPCLMCVGALVHARVRRVVYGAPEPKTGALGSAVDALSIPTLNHRFAVTSGVLEDECRAIVQAFFAKRRDQMLRNRD